MKDQYPILKPKYKATGEMLREVEAACAGKGGTVRCQKCGMLIPFDKINDHLKNHHGL